jgi:hypothetical protein
VFIFLLGGCWRNWVTFIQSPNWKNVSKEEEIWLQYNPH